MTTTPSKSRALADRLTKKLSSTDILYYKIQALVGESVSTVPPPKWWLKNKLFVFHRVNTRLKGSPKVYKLTDLGYAVAYHLEIDETRKPND